MHKKLALDIVHRLIQRISKLLEILFVEEDLVLFVFLFPHTLALGDRDVEILLGFRGFHIKEVRALAGPHPLREDLILIRVFQGRTTSLQKQLRVWRLMFVIRNLKCEG